MLLISSSIKVAIYTIFSRITGFARDILMAQYIGASVVMDALVIAIKIPSFLRRIFAEGAFNSSFIPIFANLINESEEKAADFLNNIFSFLTIVLTVIVIIFEIFMPIILPIIAPGFEKQSLDLALFFTRLTFPFILFVSLTALFSGVLNTYNKFDMAASSQIAGNIFIIIVMKLCDLSFIQNGEGVAIAITGSGIVQLLWVYFPAKLMGIKIKLSFKKDKTMKRFFKRMLPAAVGSGVLQINLFIDTIIASLLPAGTMSYLYYADRLYHLPISVTGTALGTVLLPLLSKKWQENNIKEAMHNQNRAIEFAMLITLPAMIGLIYLSDVMVSVMFERGKFDMHASIATAQTLAGFATGLPAYILIKIFNTSFFAKEDTTTPIIVAIFGMILNVALNFLLMYKYKHLGIAIATSLSSWFNAFILMILLKKRNYIRFDRDLFIFVSKSLFPSIITFGVLFISKGYLIHNLTINNTLFTKTAALIALIVSGLIAYFASSYILGLLRFKDFISKD